jgi:hypothetical protein
LGERKEEEEEDEEAVVGREDIVSVAVLHQLSEKARRGVG